MNEKVDKAGADYQVDSGDQAIQMANMIEKWLANPVSKKILKFCTKRDKCGRRIELALKDYVGQKQDLCLGCKTSKFIVSKILNRFLSQANLEKEEVLQNLRDPMWRKGLSSVLEGIAKYGPTKPFTAFSPFLIVWNFTRACNLNCKHCYEQSGHTKAPDELTTEEAKEAVDKMADSGVAYIAMSGGEPLIRKDFFEIAQQIQKREMAFSIATNGTLLTKDKVKKLEEVDCKYVQVSLDGKKKTHNWLRGSNMFEKTIQGIKNAVESDMTVGVAMTVTKKNLDEVEDVVDLTEELGADIFMHYNFIPTGRGKDIIDLDISPKQREELLKYLAAETKKRDISLLSTAPQYARVSTGSGEVQSMTHFDTFSQDIQTEHDISFLAEFIGGCGTARLYCALEPNGAIEPCVFLPIKLGNIKKNDLTTIWQNNPVMKNLRNRKEFDGKCKACEHRNICGGCRARAYGYYNNVQQSDPGCILNNKAWKKIEKKAKTKS